jgi:hypothetical protein
MGALFESFNQIPTQFSWTCLSVSFSVFLDCFGLFQGVVNHISSPNLINDHIEVANASSASASSHMAHYAGAKQKGHLSNINVSLTSIASNAGLQIDDFPSGACSFVTLSSLSGSCAFRVTATLSFFRHFVVANCSSIRGHFSSDSVCRTVEDAQFWGCRGPLVLPPTAGFGLTFIFKHAVLIGMEELNEDHASFDGKTSFASGERPSFSGNALVLCAVRVCSFPPLLRLFRSFFFILIFQITSN